MGLYRVRSFDDTPTIEVCRSNMRWFWGVTPKHQFQYPPAQFTKLVHGGIKTGAEPSASKYETQSFIICACIRTHNRHMLPVPGSCPGSKNALRQPWFCGTECAWHASPDVQDGTPTRPYMSCALSQSTLQTLLNAVSDGSRAVFLCALMSAFTNAVCFNVIFLVD